MSKHFETKYKCPKCSHSVPFTVWESVNVTLDPEQKGKIFDGSIFTTRCPVCDCEMIIPYGFLYHDMEQQIMLLFQFEEDADYSGKESQTLHGTTFPSGYRNRVVRGYKRLLEKILIFDNDLCDLDIEHIKYGLVKKYLSEKTPDSLPQIYFKQINEDSYDFYIADDNSEMYEIRFDFLECKIAKDSICLQLDSVNDGADFACIDSEWISNHLEPLPSEKVWKQLQQTYDNVGFRPYCGRIAVTKNKLSGFVDIEGNNVIPAIYKSVLPFIDGMSVVSLAVHKYGLIDIYGKEIIPCKYDNVRPYQNGYARVEKNIYWAVIDKNQNVIIPFNREYQRIEEFVNGLARVKRGTKWGVINLKGEVIVPFKYYEIDVFKRGLARVCLKPRLYGYINENGDEIVPPIYEMIGEFKRGVAIMFINGKQGLLNRDGVIILEPDYDFIGNFNLDGVAMLGKEGKIGIVNNYGKIVVPVIYTDSDDLNKIYLETINTKT